MNDTFLFVFVILVFSSPASAQITDPKVKMNKTAFPFYAFILAGVVGLSFCS